MIFSRTIFITAAFLTAVMLGSVLAILPAPADAAEPIAAGSVSKSQSAHAAAWMVVSHIFEGDQIEPSETHWIVFQDGIYYDFPSDANQVTTVFDLPRSRIILLDQAKQVQTSVLTEDLIHLAARAEAEVTDVATRQRFGMDAVARQTGELRFALEYADTQYEVTGERCLDTEVAVHYGRFVDWVCRLNIARPRGVPPFARIKLNTMMTGQNVLPRETHVKITRYLGSQRTPATIRLRSTTEISRDITPELTGKIKDAQTMRVVYPDVPWNEYEH